MLCNNNIFLHLWRYDFLGFFIVILLSSACMEALGLMLSHGVLFASDRLILLNESNHGLVTLWIKLVVVSRFKCCKFEDSVLFGLSKWIFCNWWLKVISEICYKSLSILKFKRETLIINHCPVTLNQFTITSLSIFAKNCFSFKIL